MYSMYVCTCLRSISIDLNQTVSTCIYVCMDVCLYVCIWYLFLVAIEVCTVRHFRIDRSVFPSHGVGAVHRRCQLLRSGEDDPRILYAPPNSPRILVLMDFVLLSRLLVYAFGSKITPPKNKEVVISKVEV